MQRLSVRCDLNHGSSFSSTFASPRLQQGFNKHLNIQPSSASLLRIVFRTAVMANRKKSFRTSCLYNSLTHWCREKYVRLLLLLFFFPQFLLVLFQTRVLYAPSVALSPKRFHFLLRPTNNTYPCTVVIVIVTCKLR